MTEILEPKSVSTSESQPLKPLEPTYLTINRWLWFFFTFLLSVAPTVIVVRALELSWWYSPLIIVGFWAVLFGLIYWYHTHWYRTYGYRLDDLGLSIHRGVFWQSKIFVPRNRVQHVDIASGPLDRRYALAKLIVYTAGSMHASVTLPGIKHQDAVTMRAELINSTEQETV